MRMRYVVEVRRDGEVSYPKTTDTVSEAREWIHKRYPSAIKLPVMPSEYMCGWYVDKYVSHFTKKHYLPDVSTILIKKTF